MTDLATDLGGTRTCPNCGYQVSVPQDAGPDVRCPDCGALVPTGAPPYEADGELTLDEAVRAVGVSGYDTDLRVVGDGEVACPNCGATVEAGDLQLRQVTRATDAVDRARPVSVVAVHCPNCNAAGRLVLAHDVPAERTVLDAVGAGPDEG